MAQVYPVYIPQVLAFLSLILPHTAAIECFECDSSKNFSCTEFWDPSLVVIQDFTSNCSHVFEVRMWLHTPYSCTPLYCRQSTVSRWQGCLRASWGPKGSAAPGTGETTVNTYRGLGMCRSTDRVCSPAPQTTATPPPPWWPYPWYPWWHRWCQLCWQPRGHFCEVWADHSLPSGPYFSVKCYNQTKVKLKILKSFQLLFSNETHHYIYKKI